MVTTLGADGATDRDQNGQKLDVPACQIDVVCTCSCGDWFAAGFATGLHLGRPIEDCIRFAQASSAQNGVGLGSQAVVSSLEDTIAFVETTAARA